MGSYKFDDKDWFNDSVLVDFILLLSKNKKHINILLINPDLL